MSMSLLASIPEVEIGINGDDVPLYTGSIADLNGEGFLYKLLDERGFELPQEMPEDLGFGAATNVDRKLHEHRQNLNRYGIPIFRTNSIWQRATEDSEEGEKTAEAIARGKIETFLGPLSRHLETLDEAERDAFESDLAARTAVSSTDNIILVSDDRAQYNDPIFLHEGGLYDDVRDHYNDKVASVAGMRLPPGERIKEVAGAKMGNLNLVYLFKKAVGRLADQGKQFDRRGVMTTTLSFAPMVSGSLPIPEQGIYIKVRGPRTLWRDLKMDDVRRTKKGRILTLDHFENPKVDELPDWVTLHDMKRIVAEDQTPKEREIYEGIDVDAANHYLTEVHSPAVAMNVFCRGFGVPMKGEARAKQAYSKAYAHRKTGSSRPKSIYTTAHLLTDALDREGLTRLFPPLPKRMHFNRRKPNGSLHNFLRNLEEGVFSSQAFVVADPDSPKIPISDGELEAYGNKANAKLMRYLKTGLMASYLITMSTQVGANQHHGRPHMLPYTWFRKFGLYHPDLATVGLTGDAEGEAYKLFADKKEFQKGLKEIDRETYHHNVRLPRNGFKPREKLRRKFGIKDNDCVVVGYGSATGDAHDTYMNPYKVFKKLAEEKGAVTFVTGGGTRSAMGGMLDAALDAMEDGQAVKFIGIRSESDVSPLEGKIEDYLKSRGIEIKPAEDKDAKHFIAKYGDKGEIHIYKDDRLLPRQSNIAAIGDVVMLSDGGKGTVVEFFMTALHNASVSVTGTGLLGHNNKVPLFVMNREFEHLGVKRGVFDVLLKPWREFKEQIGLVEVTGDDPVPETVRGISKIVAEYGDSATLERVPHITTDPHMPVLSA